MTSGSQARPGQEHDGGEYEDMAMEGADPSGSLSMVEHSEPAVAVGVGSVVRLRGHGQLEQDVTVVDRATGEGLWQLTTRTPLGRALLGRHAGEEVSVITDAGTAKFTIVEIRN